MPIFSQWARHTRQSVSGMLLMKWSCLSQKPSLCICSSSVGAGDGGLFPAGVGAGLVQSHRVKGGEHAHVGHDGQVVLPVAVAVGGHVDDQADVELGPAVHHRLGVLRHAAAQLLHGRVVAGRGWRRCCTPQYSGRSPRTCPSRWTPCGPAQR